MRTVEKYALLIIVALLTGWATWWFNYYTSRSTDTIDKEAMVVVSEAVREASLYHDGDISYWQDYLTGKGWKHSLCKSTQPTDCWQVYISPTASDTAIVDMIIINDTGTVVLQENVVTIFTKPHPFTVSSVSPLGNTFTATLVGDYQTPINGMGIAEYIENRP